jgi:murein DD-endopeptidase MepM/ murein hydrolase activator NlpD
MSLKDSNEGDPTKDFLSRLKSTVKRLQSQATRCQPTVNGFQPTIKRLHSVIDHFRFIVEIKAAEAADSVKTRIADIRIEKFSKLSQSAKKRIKAGALGAVVLSAVTVGAVLYLNMGPDVYQLTIAGKDAGYLTDTEMVAQAVDEVKADLSKQAPGAEVIVDNAAVAVALTDLKARKVSLLAADQVKELILSADLCRVNAWAVNINGTNVAAALTEADANSILDGVKRHYLTEGAELVGAEFRESVAVTQAALEPSELLEPDEAVKLIVTGTKEPKVYTVKDGDTLWDIAIANEMSPAELQSANPGFDPDKLKIGQQLNLFQTKPYVTVQTKEIVASTEKIDYKTVYENTSTLYKGEVKVKTPGVFGTREVKTELTKENGVIVASAQVSSAVTAQPQDQVALKGTKSIATFTGSGSLSSPVAHIEISSAYGVNRGSSRHTGVDFRNPKGTPIYAADDGVVIAVSSGGSTGKIVKLSHGNGLETWYEHCDTILVSVGQIVKKGEQIATVGMTGNATGYHLHFEVRKNGAPQNPMNYL